MPQVILHTEILLHDIKTKKGIILSKGEYDVSTIENPHYSDAGDWFEFEGTEAGASMDYIIEQAELFPENITVLL